MTTQEDYASFELTRVLKQKGYPLVKVVKDNGDKPLFYDLPKDHPDWSNCDAWYTPTLYQVQKWLIDTHNIKVLPRTEIRKDDYRVDIYDGCHCFSPIEWFPSYERALCAGLIDALKLCKVEGNALLIKNVRKRIETLKELRTHYRGDLTLVELEELLLEEEDNLTKEDEGLFI